MAPLPPQDELRRRLKAARALTGLTITQLCERIDPEVGMGERTLRKYESGETKLREPALRTLAAALDLPYAWFTVRSIARAIEGREFTERLDAIELRLERVREDAPSDRPSSQPAKRRSSPRA